MMWFSPGLKSESTVLFWKDNYAEFLDCETSVTTKSRLSKTRGQYINASDSISTKKGIQTNVRL